VGTAQRIWVVPLGLGADVSWRCDGACSSFNVWVLQWKIITIMVVSRGEIKELNDI
jgi:hypothetical protein